MMVHATLKAEPLYEASSNLDYIDIDAYVIDSFTLAQNLYHESRSKKVSDVCIAAIGYVVLERIKSRHYPNNLYDVVWQNRQFSWTQDGKSDLMLETEAMERSYKIADKVLAGEIKNIYSSSDHYLNKSISSKTWYKGMKFIGKCGGHSFYNRKD